MYVECTFGRNVYMLMKLDAQPFFRLELNYATYTSSFCCGITILWNGIRLSPDRSNRSNLTWPPLHPYTLFRETA